MCMQTLQRRWLEPARLTQIRLLQAMRIHQVAQGIASALRYDTEAFFSFDPLRLLWSEAAALASL